MLQRKDRTSNQRVNTEFEMQLFSKSSQDHSPISNLPPETMTHLFSFLELSDIRNATLVCSEWNHLSKENTLWKELCLRDWNFSSNYGNSWKSTYQTLKEVFGESLWEGMSKWIDPPGYDSEQKTTTKLQFMKKNKENMLPIVGSGVTVNCKVPSPFKIDGFRDTKDSTVISFTWKKVFDKHTSHYNGKMDLLKQQVTGTIAYNDGKINWKGEFVYTRNPPKKGKERGVLA